MASITIAGGGLIGLFCADILSKDHNVVIIEINAEIGFPANFPGIISDKLNLERILDTNNLSKIYQYKENNHVNFRTEWFVKLLCYKLTKNNVVIHHRTKIEKLSISNDRINLILKGTELKNQLYETDYLIDLSSSSIMGPSNQNHNITIISNRIIKPQIITKEFFVGTCLLNDNDKSTPFELLVQRSDGLVEIWYQYGNQLMPSKGWIESKILNAYFNKKIMIVDDYYNKAKSIINSMVI